MKTRFVESIPYEGLKNGTHLDVEVYYSKGGANYFSGGTEPRGFYISVTPATHANGMVRVTMFSGVKKLVLEANRYTDKQFDRAIEMSKGMREPLIDLVLKKEQAA